MTFGNRLSSYLSALEMLKLVFLYLSSFLTDAQMGEAEIPQIICSDPSEIYFFVVLSLFLSIKFSLPSHV